MKIVLNDLHGSKTNRKPKKTKQLAKSSCMWLMYGRIGVFTPI